MNSKLRNDFPILHQESHGKKLIYLDNAATTQKPNQVIAALVEFYQRYNAPVHRGIYKLAEQSTSLYEHAREQIARWLHARDRSEIVFTKGTTESINIVAAAWAAQHVKQGDEILLTELEHHSNLLPWQRLAQQNDLTLTFIPVTAQGVLDVTKLPTLLTSRTKLVAITHISNAIGTHNDIKTIIAAAHAVGAKVLVDAAQSAPHQRLNVQDLDVDFLAFSGHKMLAPLGTGVLYVAKRLHDQLDPYQVGGGMVYEADWYQSSTLKMPHMLEAGTPSIGDIIGLAVALEYLQTHVDFDQLRTHEANLTATLIDGLTHPRIRLLGPLDQLKKQGHMLSFTLEGVHAHDVAAYLDTLGICVRAGHHCAQPLAKKLGVTASVRASFYCYNTSQEVEALVGGVSKLLNS